MDVVSDSCIGSCLDLKSLPDVKKRPAGFLYSESLLKNTLDRDSNEEVSAVGIITSERQKAFPDICKVCLPVLFSLRHRGGMESHMKPGLPRVSSR